MEGHTARPEAMPASAMLTNEQGERRYIGALNAFTWSTTVEDAADAWAQVLDCAKSHGFEILDGDVSLASERQPIETVNFGSTTPYRNTRAEMWKPGEGMAGDVAGTKAGAATGATS